MRTIAFTALLVLTCGTTLQAQTAAPDSPVPDTQRVYRRPAAAQFLGTVVPGAGHIYSGEYVKGIRYYYGTVSGIGGGALLYAVGGMSPRKSGDWFLKGAGVAMVGFGIGVWVTSWLDAPRAAARANAKHAASASALSGVLRPAGGPEPGINAGLSVAW